MKVATLNLGSATLKLSMADVDGGDVRVARRRTVSLDDGPARDPDRLEARVLRALEEAEIRADAVDAVGHRVVHGGTRFTGPVRVDRSVTEAIEDLSSLAPFHNPAALAGLRASREHFPDRPMVAVFDTTFHAGRPRVSMVYPLPRDLTEPLGLLRYGFHGIAHASLAESVAGAEGTEAREVDAVTLQLGAGCSACAVRGGESAETSMGATPLEGLVMPARSGDVGPGALLRMVRGNGADELREALSHRSGLRGMAGTADVRELLRRERDGDDDASLALSLFVRRIVMTTGAYLTLLDGEGAVAFGGGIGSNSAEIRRRVAEGLRAWDVELDPKRNRGRAPGLVSRRGTRPVYAFETDEERLIARETARVVGRAAAGRSAGGGRAMRGTD